MAAWSAPQVHLFEPLIFFLLIADVSSDGFFVPADRVHEEPTAPKVLAHKVAPSLSIDPRQVDGALALDVAADPRHPCFGGIDSSMWTWSAIRCPSSTSDSFCSASFWNTSPRCRRSSRYSALRRHFGMKTT
jgi:hypothetical protein